MKSAFECILYGEPEISVREVLPDDSPEAIKDKNKKPFIAMASAMIKVTYYDKTYYVTNDTGYCFDGATIPFKIGKSNMKLLIPALFHDIICENKYKVGYNRYLSSLIFKDLLIQCKVNKLIAQIMFIAVDTFQRTQRGWK